MRYNPPRPDVPRCPACGSAHYPATTGAGSRVWCDGRPADPRAEHARRERERESAAFRRALLAERAARPDAPPIDEIDARRIPRGI